MTSEGEILAVVVMAFIVVIFAYGLLMLFSLKEKLAEQKQFYKAISNLPPEEQVKLMRTRRGR